MYMQPLYTGDTKIQEIGDSIAFNDAMKAFKAIHKIILM